MPRQLGGEAIEFANFSARWPRANYIRTGLKRRYDDSPWLAVTVGIVRRHRNKRDIRDFCHGSEGCILQTVRKTQLQVPRQSTRPIWNGIFRL